MKIITSLSGEVTEGELRDARGSITVVSLQDPACPGWFLELALAPAGLKIKAKRPGGASMGITTESLLELARAKVPEIFADPKTIADTQAAKQKIEGAA